MTPFSEMKDASFPVIYADPATSFKTRSAKGMGRSAERHYRTMTWPQLFDLGGEVQRVAAPHAVLLLWTTWPHLVNSLKLMETWGFQYKTCGFDWLKADGASIDLFDSPIKADMKMGYWTRSNGEPCLLGTRGRPKRQSAGVRMGVIEPARQHSRKPDIIYSRIEKLVKGPYLEMFARTQRPGWTAWGNETGKFRSAA